MGQLGERFELSTVKESLRYFIETWGGCFPRLRDAVINVPSSTGADVVRLPPLEKASAFFGEM